MRLGGVVSGLISCRSLMPNNNSTNNTGKIILQEQPDYDHYSQNTASNNSPNNNGKKDEKAKEHNSK